MKIYAMDRDYYVLKQYEAALSDAKDTLRCFTYLSQLKEAAAEEMPDAVLLESEVCSVCELMTDLRGRNPDVKIILVGNTMTPQMLNLAPDGRIQKPISENAVKQALFALKHPLLAKLRK